MRRLIIIFAFMGAAPLALAANIVSGDSVERFVDTSKAQLFICRLEIQTELLSVNASIEMLASKLIAIKDACKSGAQEPYKKVRSKIAKKPGASRLLDDYYAFWLTALSGTTPGSGEIKRDYERRQLMNNTTLEEKGNSLMVEVSR